MKVLYDFQTFTIQQYGGISRYYYELMHDYHQDHLMDYDLGVKYTLNHYLTHSDFLSGLLPVPKYKTIDNLFWGINFKGKGRVFNLYTKLAGYIDVYGENKKFTLDKIKAQDYDVFHPTYYEPYFLPHLGPKPFVVTVYDMIHEIFQETTGAMFEEKKQLVEKATKVIAISEHTKNDIIKIYGTDPAKIKVIYLANSLDPKTANPLMNLPDKYVLFVGNRNLYKNFLLFAEAMVPLLKKDAELHVVCAGGGQLYDEEKDKLAGWGVLDRFVSAAPDNASLAAAYKHALAYVCPSLYEGFGIPVLEAFACGTPAIISNISSLPEVGGDAAAYFDPKDKDSMTAAVKKVIYDEDLRQQMIAKGLQRNAEFSWHKCAEQHADLYKSIIS